MPDLSYTDSKLRKAIFHLYFWTTGERKTNFTSLLYDLIAKADWSNYAILKRAYPTEVEAYESWRASSDPHLFFKDWGACQ